MKTKNVTEARILIEAVLSVKLFFVNNNIRNMGLNFIAPLCKLWVRKNELKPIFT